MPTSSAFCHYGSFLSIYDLTVGFCCKILQLFFSSAKIVPLGARRQRLRWVWGRGQSRPKWRVGGLIIKKNELGRCQSRRLTPENSVRVVGWTYTAGSLKRSEEKSFGMDNTGIARPTQRIHSTFFVADARQICP